MAGGTAQALDDGISLPTVASATRRLPRRVFLCAIFDANRRAHHCTKPHARPAWRHKTSHFRPA
jgi:hypothetical protein